MAEGSHMNYGAPSKDERPETLTPKDRVSKSEMKKIHEAERKSIALVRDGVPNMIPQPMPAKLKDEYIDYKARAVGELTQRGVPVGIIRTDVTEKDVDVIKQKDEIAATIRKQEWLRQMLAQMPTMADRQQFLQLYPDIVDAQVAVVKDILKYIQHYLEIIIALPRTKDDYDFLYQIESGILPTLPIGIRGILDLANWQALAGDLVGGANIDQFRGTKPAWWDQTNQRYTTIPNGFTIPTRRYDAPLTRVNVPQPPAAYPFPKGFTGSIGGLFANVRP